MWSQSTNVIDRRRDRQTTCDRKTALWTKVHRAVKSICLCLWHYGIIFIRLAVAASPIFESRKIPIKFADYRPYEAKGHWSSGKGGGARIEAQAPKEWSATVELSGDRRWAPLPWKCLWFFLILQWYILVESSLLNLTLSFFIIKMLYAWWLIYIYTVGQQSKPHIFAHIFAKYWPIFIFFNGSFCGKFAIKWLLNIPPHDLSHVATLLCEM